MSKLILVTDFDGTLFDPDLRILFAPYYNMRLASEIKNRGAKLIINTGRAEWGIVAELTRRILGVKRPDVIIAGAGTKIHWLTKNKKGLDKGWETFIKKGWSKTEVLEKIIPFLEEQQITTIETKNPYMVRVLLNQKKIIQVDDFVHRLKEILGNTVKVLPAERLTLKNTEKIFSGYIIIVPSLAGKDEAAKYAVARIAKETESKVPCLLFGDGSIDIPMLTTKMNQQISTSAFGLHLTPLAKEKLKKAQNKSVIQLESSAPLSILEIVKSYKSPQNSPFRKPLRLFENIFDSLIDRSLSPDDISLLGLQKVKTGTNLIVNKSFFKRFKGFLLCAQGFVLDIFDGIRAKKHPEKKTKEGQLIDVYCDRMKEVITLYGRAKKRKGEKTVETYICAITCLLPSIARAQAQAINTIVPEFDKMGGSSLARSYKLLLSLFYETFLAHEASMNNDRKIMQKNIQTSQFRKSKIPAFSWDEIKQKKVFNTSEKEGIERLIFLVKLLQEIKGDSSRQLKGNRFQKEFEERVSTYIDGYIKVDTDGLRRNLKIKQHSFFDILQDLPQPS